MIGLSVSRATHVHANVAVCLQNLGVKKYSLLGWSNGGVTALIMAAGYPDRVQNLVVWGATAFLTQEDIDGYEKILRNIDSWGDEMRKTFIEVYGEEYIRNQASLLVDALSSYLIQFNGNLFSLLWITLSQQLGRGEG